MERCGVRNRRNQSTSGSIDGPSLKARARLPRNDCPIPSQHALPLGSQEETRQEIVRLLMRWRVGPRTHARPRCIDARSRLVDWPIPRQHAFPIRRQ
jgi:hypothetical protein